MTSHESDGVGAAEWRMFLRDRTNNRCFPDGTGVEGEPALNWTYETDDAVWSSPVIADGTIYIGSYDGHVYAISADSGDLEWRYETGGRIDGSPAVADGTVYIGSHDRNIYALDAATGEPQWMYGTRGIVRSSPLIRGDTVYIGAHCNYEVCVSYYQIRWPRTGFLYALDTETGQLRWDRELSTEGVTTTPAADDDYVYVTASERLRALDPSTGETEWAYVLDQNRDFLSSPVLADGQVYSAGNTNGDVFAVDARTGEEQWTFRTDAVVTATPVVCDGRVYIGSINNGSTFHALSTADGSEQWTFEPSAEGVGSSAVVVGDLVYFGAHNFDGQLSNDPGVYALETSTGEKQWSYHVDAEPNIGFGSSPAIVDGTLFIGSADGKLYSLSL